MSKMKMYTIARCFDKPEKSAAKRRKTFLHDHLAHIEDTIDEIFAAGPLYTYDHKTIIGSLFIYKTDDVPTAKAMLKADPYYRADIWGEIRFTPYYVAAGESVGGLAYKT